MYMGKAEMQTIDNYTNVPPQRDRVHSTLNREGFQMTRQNFKRVAQPYLIVKMICRTSNFQR